MKLRLHIDYETFSALDLTEVGSSVYSRDPSTEVLMAAYVLDDGGDPREIEQWVPMEGDPMPAFLEDALQDPEIEKWAWNASFEMWITEQTLGLPLDIRQWRCAMVQGYHCSLPGSLDKAGPTVGLPPDMQKMHDGKRLIRKFSMPRKPTKANPNLRLWPGDDLEDWERYKLYNRTDVAAERGITRRLYPYMMSPGEWELWHLDQEINRRGIPINGRMVNNAIRIYEEALEGSFKEMREITGLENPNSTAQLLPWLQDHGYPFADLKKGHVKTAISRLDDSVTGGDVHPEEIKDYWDVLQHRRDTSRTSIKKYYALQRATDHDGRIRNTLQMNGAARTGRWGGRIYQPQNLTRPEKEFEKMQAMLALILERASLRDVQLLLGNPYDALASGLRPAAQAPEGMVILDADLNAIENRVLGWLADCDPILDVFRKDQDPYIAFACLLYDKPYEELWHEYKVLRDSRKRTIGKPGVLGSGYGMGPGEAHEDPTTGEIEATGLLGYAWGMGVKSFTVEDAKLSIETFRREFKEVVDYWYAMERAAKSCVLTGQETWCGYVGFERRGPFLCMILPSGRRLYYLRPELEQRPTPWGSIRQTLTYEGMDDKKRWGRIHTTPGKIVENADQAISRDILVHGMKLAAREGLDIRLHVHDQIVALHPEDRADEGIKLLKACMEETPKWAKGLPLKAAGGVTKVFEKD